MRLMWLSLAVLLSGCQNDSVRIKNDPTYSDRNYYYQQSVVHPSGLERNATPYGTPANVGTATDYYRNLRPDAISDYSFLRK